MAINKINKNIKNNIFNQGEKRTLGVVCPTCGSTNIVKHGRKFNKNEIVQMYACKDCYKKFSFGERTRFKFRIEMIEEALIYLFNHSLRETERYINEKYKINICHETIHRWRVQFLKSGTVLNRKLNPGVAQQFTLMETLRESNSRLLTKVMEIEDRIKNMEENQRHFTSFLINYGRFLKRRQEIKIWSKAKVKK